MSTFRDLPNPSGADIEAFINQRLTAVLAQSPAVGGSFKATDYDIQVAKANHFPGAFWEYVGVIGIGIDAYIVWRMSRVKQAELGVTSLMKQPEKSAVG